MRYGKEYTDRLGNPLPEPIDAVDLADREDAARESEWEATLADDKQASAKPTDVVDPRTVGSAAILRGLHETAELAATAWDEPEPLEAEFDPAPVFPFGALPTPLAEFVEGVAGNTQTPPDACAMMVLSALSAAAGNRAWISRGSGWVEPLILWCLTALPPGSRKSAVVSRVTSPLHKIEKAIREAHRQREVGKEDLLEVAKKRKEKVMNDLAKSDVGSRTKLENELRCVRDELDKLEVKPEPLLLVDDTTPESLGIVMQDNQGHIAILSAEGGVFANFTGRYTQGTPQLDLILKSYDGEPYRTTRVGRAMVDLEHPAVSLGLTIQPHVLHETTKTPSLRERGLMGRFAYAVPQNTVGSRTSRPPEMPEGIGTLWYATLEDIVAMPVCVDEHRPMIQLSRAALDAHRDYEELLEPRMHPESGDLAYMADWVSKHTGRVLRIAGLLHLAECADAGKPVSHDTMTAAITIGGWMLEHAERVYGRWRSSGGRDITGAAAVLKWLRTTQPKSFVVRDVQQALKGQQWVSADSVKAAIVMLAQMGWVTSVARLMADGKRRLREGAFVPHPRLLE